ncbi:MAG: hypothetical protein WDO74_03415 [Pseudomonadota bacterium]
MVGRSRVLGLERAAAPSVLACLVLGAGACLGHSSHPDSLPDAIEAGGSGLAGFSASGAVGRPVPSTGGAVGATGRPGPSGPVGATGPSTGTGGAVGATGLGGCIAPPVTGKAVFADQAIDNSKLARRELFNWITDEQAAALRRDPDSFGQSEPSGTGSGDAYEELEQIARDATRPERAQLANVLGSELFVNGHRAWSEPWATRLGWPGEDYGGQLLRIVLKPEAWLAVVKDGDLTVFDLQNQPVSLAQALANPARLGAIFYTKDRLAGGPSCDVSFSARSNGYREFIVGNLASVEEWSLGTQQIRDRLSANIEQLSSFLQRTRVCPDTTNAQLWNSLVVCHWDNLGPAQTTEQFAYEQALAIPSDNYLAVPERLAALIETLHGDLFELDPLVVTPGSP